MRKTMLKILNPILALLVLSQVLTGVFNDAFPRETFEIMHGGCGVLIAVLAALHLMLNWSWVKAVYLTASPGIKGRGVKTQID